MPKLGFRYIFVTFFALLLSAVPSLAQEIVGKVVGVSDGDTITVLTTEQQPFKIRLYGIDCPETGQPFGYAAKQFTSKAAFGTEARIVVKDHDRYGRTVGVVMVGDLNVNQSLVKNGYAWWYRQYAPADQSLKQLEYEARITKLGLWSDKAPIPPWEWRKGARPKQPVVAAAPSRGSPQKNVEKPAPVAEISRTVYITRTGAKYHEAGCRHLRLSQIAISLKDAETQGYTLCLHCN